ncbi:MAG: FtsX-like permease family protein [Bacteroides sp.]|nr:FtsX-like permease family protein [Bacteroides sp.]
MFRFFMADFRRNLTKILCLSLGMAIGFLLVAKIYFQNTYDSFLPDSDRLYRICESFIQNEQYNEFNQTSGAIAPGMKRYIPQVEAATRITYIAGETLLKTEDDNPIKVNEIIFADSCFFDVIKTEILAGNPHDALSVVDQCMIPKSLADKIGGNVVGKQLTAPDWSDYKITIGGIYEDYPLNSSIRNAVYLSISTLPKFSGDGRENWCGNDRYLSFVKLAKGVSPDEIKPGIRKMLEENVDKEILEWRHYDIHARPLVGMFSSLEGENLIILLAIIILLSAAINYLLISIGQIGKRSKEMAIRKCYGTSNRKLFLMVIIESLLPLVISIGLALLIEFCLSDFCRQLLGYTPAQLFATKNIWLVEAGICLGLFIFTGIIPAWIYCKTPVAHAFRGNMRSRRGWKLGMLGMQFFASGMILCLLILVGRQYRMMGNIDMGFEYKNIGVFNLGNISAEKASTIITELKKLSCVEGVATASEDFSGYASGNNVWIDGHEEDQVNVADLYWANPDIFDVMGIRFLQGRPFREGVDSTTYEVIVEEKFIDVMRNHFDEKDPNLIGKTFHITEHGGSQVYFTICGVIENMRRGGFEEQSVDKRAGVIFPVFFPYNIVYIRFSKITPENIKLAQNIIDGVIGEENRYVYPYSDVIDRFKEPTKKFGQSVMIVGVSILVIALIGLIGFTSDEVQRRRKEIAIRKVSGTSDKDILKLFCMDILKIAVPALMLGGAASLIIGNEWLSRFTDKVSLAPIYTILCIVVTMMTVTIVITLNIMKAVRTNPMVYLREE